MSDYLWDKEGAPDPEVERLEVLLAPLAHRGRAPLLPRRRRRGAWLAVGGVALVAAVVAVVALRPRTPIIVVAAPEVASWAAQVRGTALVDGHQRSGALRLPVGAWIDTGQSRAQLWVADLGTVELEPGTQARIAATGPARHELELARGTLGARITAPPRRFIVTTPHAAVIDLGCAFRVTVDAAGVGRVEVTAGSVALADGGGREVIVAAGAACALTTRGPGAPQPTTAAVVTPGERVAPAVAAAPPHRSPAAHPKKSVAPIPAPPSTTAPAKKDPAKKEPAQKPDPGLKLKHDSLRDLDRSAPP